MNSDRTPYLTIAITNACNFRCYYCSPDGNGGFGEGFGTKSAKLDVSDLEEKIKIAEQEGITKARLTGGEPLIVKGIIDVLRFLETETSMEYALATNGSLTHRFIDDLKGLPRLDLRISLDTLKEEKFRKICGVNKYHTVINNIKELAREGILQRMAMVVTNDNIDEIGDILDFCEELKINLKLFDMYATPETAKAWDSAYSPLQAAKKAVQQRAAKVRQISYTKSFGIPSLEYELKSGITVRIKDSTSGTRYSKEFCSECESLPCQEGLYTILYSSDKRLIPCRLSPAHLEAETPAQFRKSLRRLITTFQQAYHENKFWGDKYAIRE